MKTTALRLLILAALVLPGAACSDDDYAKFPTGDASIVDGAERDAQLPDAVVLPDRITNPDGPEIVILAPTANGLITGDQMEVQARITDADSEVDPSSVKVYVTEDESFPMARQSANSDLYEGLVNISILGDGPHIVVVEAADLLGNVNTAEVVFQHDLGPTITFFSPEDQGRYAHSVNLSFEVSDPDGLREDSVSASIGSVTLNIAKVAQDDADPPTWIDYSYNIVFTDQIFDPPLQGGQMLTVQAQNTNNTASSASLAFVVDEAGPTIDLISPLPGDIVGGILEIQVGVNDEAGILESSVVAVLGGDQASYSLSLERTGSVFTGLFDTRVFPDDFVFPSISIRAADKLGNENEVGFLVALDNQPPKVSLDPPEDFRMAVINEGGHTECSREFDPVGQDAADWGDTVPQIFWLRARVEDQGNFGPGLVQSRVSLVDPGSVKLYVLSDTTHPLVVDTDGDGICDDVNPILQPSTTPQPGQELLVLNMTPIPPTGEADFRALPNDQLPAGCEFPGTGTDRPNELCLSTPMFRAIFYTVSTDEPAIYALEPVDSSSQIFCTGQQFDARANAIPEGWVCAAVRAKDNLGNIGISPPLPICIDYTLDGQPSECSQAPDPNICLGTQDPQTLEVTNTPCHFDAEHQLFRSREVRIKPN